MFKNSSFAAGMFFLPLLCIPAQAAGNVKIEADKMEIIDSEHKTIFHGNVVAVRPTDTIKANEMTVYTSDQKQADGSIKSVTDHVEASGNVIVTSKDTTITGARAHIDTLHDTMVVTGQASLNQGANVLNGERIEMNLKTHHATVSGGRVNGNFVP